jgi:hypothetical protein
VCALDEYTAGADLFYVRFYVRTTSHKEIDFVGEALAGAAIEAKYVQTGRWVRPRNGSSRPQRG